jgi:hypothetical protein
MSDLSIHPVYLSARAAIVTPEKAIPVTFYSVEKWLSRLGAERWCLVMVLRSLSIDIARRSDGTKRVTCSWRELAELLDVHEETVASWLKHQPIPNEKPWRRIIPVDDKSRYLSLFIPRLRYAYQTHGGKTRRTGFILEVLMEDPVAPEDEAKLQQRIEILQMQQAELGLESYHLGLESYHLSEQTMGGQTESPHVRLDSVKSDSLNSHYVNQIDSKSPTKANPYQMGLHNTLINPKNMDLQAYVKQHNVELSAYVNPMTPDLHNDKSEKSEKNVNKLDILIQQLKHNNLHKPRKKTLESVVLLTEELLNDHHSTAMFYKVLNVLYPERLDLYVAAVRVAMQATETDPDPNLGAIFVRSLREFADVAGVDLGLKANSDNLIGKVQSNGDKPGVEPTTFPASTLAPPSVGEAIWAETQLVLQRQMTRATYDAVVQGTQLMEHDSGVYIVGVQSNMAKEWLENRLRDVVQRALSSVIGVSVKVQFRLIN